VCREKARQLQHEYFTRYVNEHAQGNEDDQGGGEGGPASNNNNNNSADLDFLQYVKIEALVDNSYQSDADVDPRSPLLEREFGEALVRCIAEASCRSGVTGPLYDTVFKVLAEKVNHVANGHKLPNNAFVAALHEDAVQAIVIDYAPALRTLWAQLVESARRDGFGDAEAGVVQFRHMIKVFQALRGIAVDGETTVLELVEAMGKCVLGKSVDVTVLLLPVTYEDFVEMLCRLLVSDHWIYERVGPPSVAEAGGEPDQKSEQRSEQRSTMSGMSMHHKMATAMLANRLKAWLQSI